MSGNLIVPADRSPNAEEYRNWPAPLEDPQTCLERIQSAELLMLPWEIIESCDCNHKPKLRSSTLSFLRAYADKIILLSNDSTCLPRKLQSMLQRQGIRLPLERILLAGHQTLLYVKQTASTTRIYLVAEPRLHGLANRLGLRRAGRDAEMLVLMQDHRFDANKLAFSATLVRQGGKPKNFGPLTLLGISVVDSYFLPSSIAGIAQVSFPVMIRVA